MSQSWSHLNSEVVRGLDDFPPSAAFPDQVYRAEAIRAIIADDRGEHETAVRHAKMATEAAALRRSGIRHHPRLGLVTDTLPGIHERLVALAAESS